MGKFDAEIAQLLDGDSARVEQDDSKRKEFTETADIRVKGVDTGETEKNWKITGSPAGEVAHRAAQGLLDDGAYLETDGSYDKHGRQLANFRDKDGNDLAPQMLEAGLGLPTGFGNADEQKQSAMSGIVRDSLGLQRTSNPTLRKYSDELKSKGYSWQPFTSNPDAVVFNRKNKTGSTFGNSVDRGMSQVKGSVGGFLNWLGDATGSQTLLDEAKSIRLESDAEIAVNQREVESYKNVDSLEKGFTYAIETLGELAPQIIIDGVAAAATGGTSLAGTAARHGLVGAAKTALVSAGKRGMLTGYTVSSALQGIGNMENRLDEVEEGQHTGASLTAGVATAAFELAPVLAVFGDVMKSSGLSKEVTDGVAKALTDVGKRTPIDRARDIIKTAGKGGAVEGLTESAQGFVDEVIFTASSGQDWSYDTEQAVEAMLRGVIGGSAMGGGASTLANTVDAVRTQYEKARNDSKGETEVTETVDVIETSEEFRTTLDKALKKKNYSKKDDGSDGDNGGFYAEAGDIVGLGQFEGKSFKDVPNLPKERYQEMQELLEPDGKMISDKQMLALKKDGKFTDRELAQYAADDLTGTKTAVIGNYDNKIGDAHLAEAFRGIESAVRNGDLDLTKKQAEKFQEAKESRDSNQITALLNSINPSIKAAINREANVFDGRRMFMDYANGKRSKERRAAEKEAKAEQIKKDLEPHNTAKEAKPDIASDGDAKANLESFKNKMIKSEDDKAATEVTGSELIELRKNFDEAETRQKNIVKKVQEEATSTADLADEAPETSGTRTFRVSNDKGKSKRVLTKAGQDEKVRRHNARVDSQRVAKHNAEAERLQRPDDKIGGIKHESLAANTNAPRKETVEPSGSQNSYEAQTDGVSVTAEAGTKLTVKEPNKQAYITSSASNLPQGTLIKIRGRGTFDVSVPNYVGASRTQKKRIVDNIAEIDSAESAKELNAIAKEHGMTTAKLVKGVDGESLNDWMRATKIALRSKVLEGYELPIAKSEKKQAIKQAKGEQKKTVKPKRAALTRVDKLKAINASMGKVKLADDAIQEIHAIGRDNNLAPRVRMKMVNELIDLTHKALTSDGKHEAEKLFNETAGEATGKGVEQAQTNKETGEERTVGDVQSVERDPSLDYREIRANFTRRTAQLKDLAEQFAQLPEFKENPDALVALYQFVDDSMKPTEAEKLAEDNGRFPLEEGQGGKLAFTLAAKVEPKTEQKVTRKKGKSEVTYARYGDGTAKPEGEPRATAKGARLKRNEKVISEYTLKSFYRKVRAGDVSGANRLLSNAGLYSPNTFIGDAKPRTLEEQLISIVQSSYKKGKAQFATEKQGSQVPLFDSAKGKKTYVDGDALARWGLHEAALDLDNRETKLSTTRMAQVGFTTGLAALIELRNADGSPRFDIDVDNLAPETVVFRLGGDKRAKITLADIKNFDALSYEPMHEKQFDEDGNELHLTPVPRRDATADMQNAEDFEAKKADSNGMQNIEPAGLQDLFDNRDSSGEIGHRDALHATGNRVKGDRKGRTIQLERKTKKIVRKQRAKARHVMLKFVRSTRTRLDAIHPEIGKRTEKFVNTRRMRTEQLIAKMGKHFPSTAAMQRGYNDIIDGRNTEDATRYKAFIAEVSGFVRKHDPQFVTDTPIHLDYDKVANNVSGVTSILREAGVKNPSEVVEQIINGRGYAGWALDPNATRPKGSGNSQLKPALDKLRQGGFLDTDAPRHLTRYIHGAASWAAWNQQFGGQKDGSYSPNARYLELEAEVHPAERNEIDKLMQGVTGRTGSNMPPFLRKFNSVAMAFQMATVGWFTAVSSIPEFAAVMARQRSDINDFGDSMRKAMWTPDRKEMMHRAQELEIVTDTVIQHTLNELYNMSDLTTGRVSQRITDKVFEYNGQNWLTSLNRAVATRSAEMFIRRHANGDSPNSARMLAELGLDPLTVKTYQETQDINSAEGKAYRDAVHQFVNEAVTNPTATQLPLIANDPRFVVLTTFKKFFYGFTHNVHKSLYRDAKLRRQEGMNALLPMMLTASVIIPLAGLAELMKELIKYPLGRPDGRKQGVEDWTKRTLLATGGLGSVANSAISIRAHRLWG